MKHLSPVDQGPDNILQNGEDLNDLKSTNDLGLT